MRQDSIRTLQSAVESTGNGEELRVAGYGVASLQVTGTFVGTVTFEGTVDHQNWSVVQVKNKGTGATATTATAVGIFDIDLTGLEFLRARISAYTSGAITIVAKCSDALPTAPPSTINATVDSVKVTDSAGTNTLAPDADGHIGVKVNGSNSELPPGLAAERPAASADNKGKTYWSVDTGDVSVSTGAAWRSVGVA